LANAGICVEKILEGLTQAVQLSASGNLPGSLVMSWAGLEATMRQAIKGSRTEVENSSPVYLLRVLYSDGFLAREELDQLASALEIRNALIHGLTVPAISPAAVQYVVSAAKKILTNNGKNGHR
jgi:hypothetical protein